MSLEPREIPDKSQEMLILSKDQWNRIHDHIDHDVRLANIAKAQIAERKNVLKTSKNMTDNWKNTIVGLHKQRLENRQLKLYNEEVQRVHTDILEEKYQENRRKYVLDQAKKRLYFQTDRVKRLHGAKALAETIKERDIQREFNKGTRHVFDEYDTEYTKCILRDVERHEEKLKQDSQRKELMKKKVAADLKEQFSKVKSKMDQEKEDEYRLGRLIMEEDERYTKEAEEEEIELKKQKHAYKKLLNKEIELKNQIKASQQKMEEADIRRAKLFDDAKRRMIKMHKEKQAEFEKLKDERKNMLLKGLLDDIGKRRLKEEKSYKKAIKEKEAHEKERMREEAEKQMKALEGIQEYYNQTLARKEEERVEDMRQSLNEGRKLREDTEEYFKEEMRKAESRKKAGKELEHFQVHQIVEQRNQKSKAIQEGMEDYLKHLKSLREEEELFQIYAKQLIADSEKKGMNTYPLKKVAEPGIECGKGPIYKERGGIRPKYLASVADADELHYVTKIVPKEKINVRKRLGFTH